jgi:Lon protease-like protein
MDDIPLFPLGNALFPAGVLSLQVFEVRYLDMVRKCMANRSEFGVVVLLDGREVRTPEGKETLAGVGTLARIDECRTIMPGLLQLRCSGTTRFRLLSSSQGRYGLWSGSISALPDDPETAIEPTLQPCADTLGKLIAELQREGVSPQEMPVAPPFRLDDAGWVANRWSELLPLAPQEKADLLALDDPTDRLKEVRQVLAGRGLL